MDSNVITRSIWPGYEFDQSLSSSLYFQSSLLSQFATINHAFFSRQGGQSHGLYSSFNMNFARGDKFSDVYANRLKVCKFFNISINQLITLRQAHGNNIVEITDRSFNESVGDAIITNMPCLAIGVLTADCIPILIYAPTINYIAAIHAGRLGLQKGIISQTILALINKGASPKDMIISLGPSIQKRSYQVSQDIFEQFRKVHPQYLKFFGCNSESDKFHLDLVAIALHQLRNAGIQQIDISLQDTFENPELFFSYRYACHHKQNQFGNQISVIQLA